MTELSNTPLWQKAAQQYQQRPLLLGGATVVLVLFIFALFSSNSPPEDERIETSFTGSVDYKPGKTSLDWVTGNLDRLQDYELTSISGMIVDRLNQWMIMQPPGPTWHTDALVSNEAERNQPLYAALKFNTWEKPRFLTPREGTPPLDGMFLVEAKWLKDISDRLAEEGGDNVALATRLFDWTVRHVELKENNAPFQPWQTVLFGSGVAQHRAWIFMLLTRQQGLDVVMLNYRDPETPQLFNEWIPALLQGPELYLFDHRLGIPIPGPDGAPVATLAQVAADDGLLRQLDLPSRRLTYPVRSEDVQKVAVAIEASPLFLTRRMEELEASLSGDEKLVLTVDPSYLRRQLAACPQVERDKDDKDKPLVAPWSFPYQIYQTWYANSQAMWQSVHPTLVPFMMGLPVHKDESVMKFDPAFIARQNQQAQNPDQQLPDDDKEEAPDGVEFVNQVLWKGRMLHFQGFWGTAEDKGSIYYYQLARPSSRTFEEWQGHLKQIRSAAAEGPGLPPEEQQQLEQTEQTLQQMLSVFPIIRSYATYWLGQAQYEKGDPGIAVDYLKDAAEDPRNQFKNNTQYNLARCYETLGKDRDAIAIYDRLISPQRHGNLLRARALTGGLPEVEEEPEMPVEAPPVE